jgi:N-acetylglucosaminyl-diphospho-decaprenol L-rhamnosyltransferase
VTSPIETRANDTTARTELTLVVVTHGGREATLACLESIEREALSHALEVVIIDNASPHRLVEELEARFPAFLVLILPSNIGFAAAANIGAARAGGRYLLFLNPDTRLQPGTIDGLMAFARERPRAGIWGGRTLFGDGTLNPMSCWRRPSLWTLLCTALALDTAFPNSALFHSVGYGGWRRDAERAVDVVSGCFLLVERGLFDRLGGFSPAFFMYGEDVDLCLRARRLGARPAISPAATIVHYGSGSEGDQARKNRQLLAARVLLVRRHFTFVARLLAYPLLALRPALGTHLAAPRLRSMWRQVWEARSNWLSGRF